MPSFPPAGNAIPYQSLGPGAVLLHNLDLSTVASGRLYLVITPGATVGTPNGVRMTAFEAVMGGYSATPYDGFDYEGPVVASTTAYNQMILPTGSYQIRLINTDPTYSVTVEGTLYVPF